METEGEMSRRIPPGVSLPESGWVGKARVK